jgi:hypothetical protein
MRISTLIFGNAPFSWTDTSTLLGVLLLGYLLYEMVWGGIRRKWPNSHFVSGRIPPWIAVTILAVPAFAFLFWPWLLGKIEWSDFPLMESCLFCLFVFITGTVLYFVGRTDAPAPDETKRTDPKRYPDRFW